MVPPIGISGLRRLAAETDDTCVRDVFLAEVPLRLFPIRHTERLEIRFDGGVGGLTRLGVNESVTMADEHWFKQLARAVKRPFSAADKVLPRETRMAHCQRGYLLFHS